MAATQTGTIKAVGILTAGGDCPGLNAAIRGVAKALAQHRVEIFGFLDGFMGLIENRFIKLGNEDLSGMLTLGGTILRTSRTKPHKVPMPNGTYADMTDVAVENYRRLQLDCLVCLGGGGTQKNAHRLMKKGNINVVTLPKTIDNDVWGTDICFGFDSAMSIATEAIDRLHTTASSHHRVMVVDIMGHNAGWLALGSGIAGGADVILIPEIPYSMDVVSEALLARMRRGKMFSIVAVAEGAMSDSEEEDGGNGKGDSEGGGAKKRKKDRRGKEHSKEPVSVIIAEHLEEVTQLETRVTSLGHLQRGGVPTPRDRLLCTKFGATAAQCILDGKFGCMIAQKGSAYVPIPLEDVVGKRRLVTLDHPWVNAALHVDTCLGADLTPGNGR